MDYNNPNQGYQQPNYQQPAPQDDVTRGKTVAILSYCTLLGWIIAIILHQQDKTKFGAFHLRQGLGLFITWIACAIVVGITSPLFGFISLFLLPLVALGILTLLIIGLINAINGKMTPAPVVGGLSEKILAGIQ
jgi:uncharacterized membrane protein